MIKSFIRDLDIFTYLLSYIQDWVLRQWYHRQHIPYLVNRTTRWRQEYDRVLYRHQNFISEHQRKLRSLLD
jgi:hypothetical protein